MERRNIFESTVQRMTSLGKVNQVSSKRWRFESSFWIKGFSFFFENGRKGEIEFLEFHSRTQSQDTFFLNFIVIFSLLSLHWTFLSFCNLFFLFNHFSSALEFLDDIPSFEPRFLGSWGSLWEEERVNVLSLRVARHTHTHLKPRGKKEHTQEHSWYNNISSTLQLTMDLHAFYYLTFFWCHSIHLETGILRERERERKKEKERVHELRLGCNLPIGSKARGKYFYNVDGKECNV